MKMPWTIGFIREWWPYMTLDSVWDLRRSEIRRTSGELNDGQTLVLQMKRPVKGPIEIREVGSDILTFEETFRSEIYSRVVAKLRHCETIIDLGANIGLASLYFTSYYRHSRVFSVEPNPSSYQMLTRNLKPLIAKGRCQTLQAAVWSSDAALTGGSDRQDHYSTFATQPVEKSDGSEMTITGVPIQKIIAAAGFDQIDLLKIDIEGAEIELFRVSLEWLRKVRSIAIEFHSDSRERSRFDAICREYNFDIVDEGDHTVFALRG